MKYLLWIFLLLSGMTVLQAAVPEITSQGGRAAEFIDIKGCWLPGVSPQVRLLELPDRLIVEMTLPPSAQLHKVVRAKHDDPALLSGESVEVLFCPDPAKKVYYHIGLNPAGDLYTACCQDVSWEPAKFKCTFDGWKKICMEIFYSGLGVSRPAPGSVWRANFGWTHAEKNGFCNTASWSGAASFHDIEAMGILRFGESAARPLILRHNSTSVETERNFQDWKIEVEQNGKKWRASSNYAETPEKNLPLKEDGVRTLRFRSLSGKILWEKSAIARFDNRAMLELDRYYYVEKDAKAVWKSDLRSVKNFLLLRSGRAVKQWKSSAASGEFALSGLPSGGYELRLDNRFSRLFFYRKEPWKTQDAPCVYTVKNHRIYRDNTPVFLLTGSVTRIMALHHGNVFNLQFPRAQGCISSALKLADLPGKKLIRCPGTGYAFGSAKETAALLEKYGKVQNSAPLAIHRLAYEAQMKAWYRENGKLILQKPEELYRKNAVIFKKAAPYQLTSIHIDNQAAIPRFSGFTDVFELTPRGAYERSPLPQIADSMAEAAAVAGKQILLYWFGVTVPDSFSRTAEELRAELYLAMLYGGSGAILHLGHGSLPAERTRLWSLISQISGELNSIYPEWVKGTPVPVKAPAPFHAKARLSGGKLLILAVNPTARRQLLKMTLPGGKQLRAEFTAYEPQLFRVEK